VLGVGTHNYEATYYQLREEPRGWVRQPHMLPLEVLGERGIVGGVLFAGFLSVCVLGGLWWRFRGLNPEGRAQAGALLAAVTYWAVHSGVEWFWQIPAVTLPAMVYLGLLVAPWKGAGGGPLRWPSRTGIAVTAGLTIALLSPLYVADRYLAQSYAITDLGESLAAVERAERLNPVSPSIPQREAELAGRAGDEDRAERAHLRAISLNPEHFAPYALLAASYQESGDLDRALPMYREALERNPLDEDLARVVEELGETEPR
jgi:tetratricopeptide (TPR) repeat protein